MKVSQSHKITDWFSRENQIAEEILKRETQSKEGENIFAPSKQTKWNYQKLSDFDLSALSHAILSLAAHLIKV